MFDYTIYGPYLCFAGVFVILFLIWMFWSDYGNQLNSINTFDHENVTICEQEVDNTPIIPERFQPLKNICPSEMMMTESPIKIPPPPTRRVSANGGRFVSRGERICGQVMERIYGVEFKSVWPEWLVNPETGRKLELDCYNEELQIAVEYNGEQHYKWPNFTNQSKDQFINQVRRDRLKKKLCDRYGVYLIVVPYNVDHTKISDFIMEHLPETIQRRLMEERTLDDICLATED